MGFLPALNENGFFAKPINEITRKSAKRKKIDENVQNGQFRSRCRLGVPKYIGSKRWAKRRRRYYAMNPNVCEVCGSRDKLTLHHLTYERLGMEDDKDLVPLCWPHHEALHDMIGGSKEKMRDETELYIQAARLDENQARSSVLLRGSNSPALITTFGQPVDMWISLPKTLPPRWALTIPAGRSRIGKLFSALHQLLPYDGGHRKREIVRIQKLACYR